MKKLFIGAASVLAVFSVSSANAVEMRCSHQLPPKHHIAKVIDKWAAEVESQSNGNIDVQIFGANSLRNAKQNIGAVAKGVGLFAALGGGLIGGWFLSKSNLFICLVWFGIFQALSNLGFLWLSLIPKPVPANT